MKSLFPFNKTYREVVEACGDRMMAAQALYWYCHDNHGGQGDTLYITMCNLAYKPGLCESGPECQEAQIIYTELQEKRLDADRLFSYITGNLNLLALQEQ
jgi:hypothetical protein